MVLIAGANAQRRYKMSPLVRKASAHLSAKSPHASVKSPSARKAIGTPSLTAFVRCTDEQALTDNSCRILARFSNDIYVASIPLARLDNLSESRHILRIEAGRRCSTDVDTTAFIVRSDALVDGNIPIPGMEGLRLTGKNVVVGVQDVGFDLTHPTLYSTDGSRYRVRRFWDMIDADTIGSELCVGRDYVTESDILQKAHSTDAMLLTHGTHTSGIAGGSGWEGEGNHADGTPQQRQSRFRGIAPDAELVFVANAVSDDLEFIAEEDVYKYTTATDILGFKYIFDYADSLGLPCVINFSEGAHQDFSEMQLFDEALAELMAPGHIIVASAGNEGRKLSYLSKPGMFQQRRSLYYSNSNEALLSMRSDGKLNVRITLNAGGNAETAVEIRSEEHEFLDSIYCDTIQAGETLYVIERVFFENPYDSLSLTGELYIQDLTHETLGSGAGRVLLTLFETEEDMHKGQTSHQELFYYAGQFISSNTMPSDAEPTHNIHFPGSSPSVVCVGATGHRPGITNYYGSWKRYENVEPSLRSGYSSVGPSYHGLTKPDVMAPGTNIISAYSSYYWENMADDELKSTWVTDMFEHNGRRYYWASDSGTSMSSPVVTGVIALWLEACPVLTLAEVMETIAQTSRYPLGIDANPQEYGYGEIDAVAGLQYIREHFLTAVSEVTCDRPADNAIYDISGRRVSSPQRGVYIRGGKPFFVTPTQY